MFLIHRAYLLTLPADVQGYDACFHITSYECKGNDGVGARPGTGLFSQPVPAPPPQPPPPTPQPIQPPKFIDVNIPILLVLMNVMKGYSLTASDRARILIKVEDMIEEALNGSCDLLHVSYAGKYHGSWQNRRLSTETETLFMPIIATLNCREDLAEMASQSIMKYLMNNMNALVNHVKKINPSAFANLQMNLEKLDLADVDMRPPTLRPTPRMVVAKYPFLLTLMNVMEGYSLSDDDSAKVLSKVTEIVEDALIPVPSGLIGVEFGGRYTGPRDGRSLLRGRHLTGTLFLPMIATFSCSEDLIDMSNLAIMEAMMDNMESLLDFLKAMNPEAFANAQINVEKLDLADVVKESTDETSASILTNVPWWVWVLLAGIMLLFCICCYCRCAGSPCQNYKASRGRTKRAEVKNELMMEG